jgi:citrate lyase subunit beta / citryl-CoA lyase
MNAVNQEDRRRLPVWRSLFVVPLTSDRFVEGAHTRGADAIVLDLEDGVAVARKEEARGKLSQAVAKVGRGGADILVRVNRPLRMGLRDIEAAVIPGVVGLVLPKVPDASYVRLISEVVSELETERKLAPGTVRLVAVVETAKAYPRMEEIAAADPRVIGMCLGVEDFSMSCGMLPEADGLYVPKMQMLVLARAAGILPIGTLHSIADYRDLDGWRAASQRAWRLGYRGAFCVHPGQISILNESFRATRAEVEYARRVVAAAAQAQDQGLGAFEFEGKMIDAPVLERVRGILDIEDAIQAAGKGAGA